MINSPGTFGSGAFGLAAFGETPVLQITVGDSISIAETVATKIPALNINVSDSIAIADEIIDFYVGKPETFEVSITEPISVEDAAAGYISLFQIEICIADSIKINENLIVGHILWYPIDRYLDFDGSEYALNASTDRYTILWNPTGDYDLEAFRVYVKPNGSPSGDLECTLQGITNRKPNGSVVATATAVDASTLSEGWYEFIFSSPPTLSSGVETCVVFENSDADAVNYIGFGLDNLPSDGNSIHMSSNDSGSSYGYTGDKGAYQAITNDYVDIQTLISDGTSATSYEIFSGLMAQTFTPVADFELQSIELAITRTSNSSPSGVFTVAIYEADAPHHPRTGAYEYPLTEIKILNYADQYWYNNVVYPSVAVHVDFTTTVALSAGVMYAVVVDARNCSDTLRMSKGTSSAVDYAAGAMASSPDGLGDYNNENADAYTKIYGPLESHPASHNRRVDDFITVTETVAVELFLRLDISVSDSISIIDTVRAAIGLNIDVSDAIAVAETVDATISLNISVADSISIAETVAVDRKALYHINVSDSISIAEIAAADGLNLVIKVSDLISVGETVRAAISLNIGVSDAINVAEIAAGKLTSLNTAVIDSIGIVEVTDAVKGGGTYNLSVADQITIGESAAAFTWKDLQFVAHHDGTMTIEMTYSGNITITVDGIGQGPIISGVPKDIDVLEGDEVLIQSSQDWTSVTEFNIDDAHLTGDISVFAPLTNLTLLHMHNSHMYGALSGLAPLTVLESLDFGGCEVSADANCLNIQTLMTYLDVSKCRLTAIEMENLMASLVINEAAGEPARDCTVLAD